MHHSALKEKVIRNTMGVTAIIVTDVALYTLFNIALNSKIKTVNA